jgi:hypothetical protein
VAPSVKILLANAIALLFWVGDSSKEIEKSIGIKMSKAVSIIISC